MIKTNIHAVFLLLAISIFGCSSAPESGQAASKTVSQIRSVKAGDMSTLSRIGNVWISEQPTKDDLIWIRDNQVSVVIDTRMRHEDRGFDERAFVVSLGMDYRAEPLNNEMDYSIDYFDRARETFIARRGVPTFIHGETADRPAAVWLSFRVLDDRVPYAQALAEAKIAGLSNPNTIRLVNQYLLFRGVDIQTEDVKVESTPGPDEEIFEVQLVDEKEDAPSESIGTTETTQTPGTNMEASSDSTLRE